MPKTPKGGGETKSIYARNFLSSVVLRLDFAAKTELNFLPNFSSEIKAKFPVQEQKHHIVKSILLDKEGDVQQGSSKMIFWNFFNTTKTRKLEIAPDHIFIEYKDYVDSSELLEDAEQVICKFLNSSKVETIARLGLRYINDIPFTELEGKSLVSLFTSALLGAVDFSDSIAKKYARAMGQIVFKEDDANVTFNFGIWNSDFPNEAMRPNFILDIDCYSELPFEAEADKLRNLVQNYNKYAESIFENSITDELRARLNAET